MDYISVELTKTDAEALTHLYDAIGSGMDAFDYLEIKCSPGEFTLARNALWKIMKKLEESEGGK